MPHTFKLGDRVLFNPKAGPDDLDFFILVTSIDLDEGKVWEVVRTLPPADGIPQYHIRSRQDGHEQSATQPQLRPAL
jgi:hypothetical protein